MIALMLAAALAAEPALPVYPETSIYRVEGRFEDQTGRATALDVARGRPVLIAMFYATCPRACPMLIADLERVRALLSTAERAHLRVVLVSLDPAHDTPAVLANVSTERKLGPNVTLLRSDALTTRTLGATLGVRYRSNDDGSIEHTSKIVLLDAAGVPLAERPAIGADPTAFVAAIHAALRPFDP